MGRFLFPRGRAYFDPNTLSPSGFWPDTWDGATNAFYPVGETLGSVLSATGYAFAALVKIDEVDAVTSIDNTQNGRINNHAIFSGDNGHVACYLRKSGSNYFVGLTHSSDNGATYVNAEMPITLGTWTRVHGRFTGSAIQIGVDGTWSSPVAAASLHATTLTKGLRVFRNHTSDLNGGAYDTKGRLRDLFFKNATLTDVEFTSIVSDYYVGRYGFPTGLEAPVAASPFPPTTTPNANTYSTSLRTATPGWAQHDGARLAFFNGKWRKYGGWDNVNASNNRIYSTTNPGGTWTLDHEHDDAPPTTGPTACFSPRHCFGLCELGGYLYIFGGDLAADTGGGLDPAPWTPCDVWRTSDGVTLTRIVGDTPWNDNALYIGAAYQDAIHVLCGVRGVGQRTRCEHWKGTVSADGSTVNWTRLPDPPFARFGVMQAVVHDGKLVVVGGATGPNLIPPSAYLNSTWAYDGHFGTWALQSASAPWSGREWAAVVVYDGKIWRINGRDSVGEVADAYWSSDLSQTWMSIGAVPWPASHADAVAATEAGGIIIPIGYGGVGVYDIQRNP